MGQSFRRLVLAHPSLDTPAILMLSFQMAEVAVPRDLFRRTLGMIDDLRPREPASC